MSASSTTGQRRAVSSVRVSANLRDAAGLSAELAKLEKLGLDDLRLQWRNRWGRLAPARLPRGLLYRVMAYRLQAETFGDLDRETKRLLDRLAEQTPSEALTGDGSSTASTKAAASPPAPADYSAPLVLKPGALLTREWQGRMERVMVLEEGFAWNGKTYSSVSAVALAITGVKWNGRRFFFGTVDKVVREGTGRGKKATPQSRMTVVGPAETARTRPPAPPARRSLVGASP
jgi:hypothetical protein